MKLKTFMEDVHNTAVYSGFWATTDYTNIPTKLALIHSEISEALEEYRMGRLNSYESDYKPEGMVIELADAIIRILDLCAFYDLDIVAALREKSDYNKTRAYRHGEKKV